MILVVLLILAILSERASVALTSTLIDVTNSRKYRTEREIFARAEAGLEEARARILATSPNFIGDPSPTPNPLWSAYILTSSSWKFSQDPTYNSTYTNYIPTPGVLTKTQIQVNSLQTSLPYWIKIRHKREYDAEVRGHKTVGSEHYYDGDGATTTHSAANPGNILYYGYYPAGALTPVQFTSLGTPNAQPVELVQAYDSSSGKWIEVDAVRAVGPPILAAVYMEGNMTFAKKPQGKGSSPTGNVDGTDNCAKGKTKGTGLPPVYTKKPAKTTGDPKYDGNPDTPQEGDAPVDIKKTINSLKGGATVLTKDPDPTKKVKYGDKNNYVTVYSDTANPPNINGLEMENVTGYGILLVDGNLTLRGKTDWNGLVVVDGLITFDNKPGELNVFGGILSSKGGVAIDKNPDLRYDSCELANALGSKPLKFTQWRYR